MRVGIALGSNLGDRVARLRAAVAAIRAFADSPVLISRLYETEPVNCPPGSPAFLNAALEIGYCGELPDLLERLQTIERQNDRPRIHGRNTPRTVDLDILYADEQTLELPGLKLPHPRLMDRLFVLSPLCDIVPERKLPGANQTFRERKEALLKANSEKIEVLDSVEI